MKTGRALTLVALLALALGSVLAGCASSGGTTTGSTGPAPTATAAAKATPSPLSSHPNITVAYCQQLLSLSVANQIIPSSSPATTITQGNPNDAKSGACNYVISPARILLIIYFIPYSGPQQVTQQDIAALLSQAAGTNITVTTATPVSGIGLTAEYVEATGTDPSTGTSTSAHVLYVLEGSYIFDCVTYQFLSPVLATQSQLQQCATQVDSVLRQ